MIERRDVVAIIRRYLEVHPEEIGLNRLLGMLLSGNEVFSRAEARGHITCSALLLNADRKVLLIHHRVLRRWLLPGGHVENADRSLQGAALRELLEEVGIHADAVAPLSSTTSPIPIDIDHHRIPANPRKEEPAHYHWDFRFVFRAWTNTLQAQLSEINEAAWRDPSQLNAKLRTKLRDLLIDESRWRAA